VAPDGANEPQEVQGSPLHGDDVEVPERVPEVVGVHRVERAREEGGELGAPQLAAKEVGGEAGEDVAREEDEVVEDDLRDGRGERPQRQHGEGRRKVPGLEPGGGAPGPAQRVTEEGRCATAEAVVPPPESPQRLPRVPAIAADLGPEAREQRPGRSRGQRDVAEQGGRPRVAARDIGHGRPRFWSTRPTRGSARRPPSPRIVWPMAVAGAGTATERPPRAAPRRAAPRRRIANRGRGPAREAASSSGCYKCAW